MNLAERVDTVLADANRFSTARAPDGLLWISENPVRRIRPAWRVAYDLQQQLERSGLPAKVGEQLVDGRTVPCVEIRDHPDRTAALEVQRLLVVSPVMLEKFRAVRDALQQLNRKNPGYDNVKAFANLIQQGLFLSRRKVKDTRRRVERVRTLNVGERAEAQRAALTAAIEAAAPSPSLPPPSAQPIPVVFSPREPDLAVVLERDGARFGSFVAFSCAWEVHLHETTDFTLRTLTQAIANEVQLIEVRYSSRQPSGLVHRLAALRDQWLVLDPESESLFDAAHRFWELSEGRLDATTDALGRYWGEQARLATLALAATPPTPPAHGWHLVARQPGRIHIPSPLTIDLDGFAKGHALDRARALLDAEWQGASLLLAGDDLAADRGAVDNWRQQLPEGTARLLAEASSWQGALAIRRPRRASASRDRRDEYPTVDGRTGRPVESPAQAVAVLCHSSLDAHGFASAGLLQGWHAEALLAAQPIERFWVQR